MASDSPYQLQDKKNTPSSSLPFPTRVERRRPHAAQRRSCALPLAVPVHGSARLIPPVPAAASSPVAVSSRCSVSGRRNPSRRRWSLAVRHHLLLLLPLMPPALGPLSITDTRWPACRLRQPADLRSLCSPIRANGGRSLPGVAVGATCTCCLPAPRRWATSAGAAYTAAHRHAHCLWPLLPVISWPVSLHHVSIHTNHVDFQEVGTTAALL